MAIDARTRGFAADRAVVAMLGRAEARPAAWRAARDQWTKLNASLVPADLVAIITATGGLCDLAARAEVAATISPRIADLPDGTAVLTTALLAIDRCAVRRTRFGDLGAALKRN
jgi:hypothetical protein